ncbi:MAG: 50S ribosomal protein L24 [Lentisphaerae bacterium ADurb.Bin242]|nr:MAG: 50S ribosomal protein L24 [Lentisphaerae bacterium ADurb.Bin242]
MFSEKKAKSYHVKKGDAVEVITGEWKKETGKVIAVLKKKDRVVLEMQGIPQEKLSARLGKRTIKKSQANPKGGLVERAVSVHVSNVRKKD